MLKNTLFIFSLGVALVAASTAFAADIKVEDAWTRAALSSKVKNAAGYLKVTNTSKDDDRLLGIYTDVAERNEVHSMTFVDGVMRMNEIEALDIPAGETVYLKPGGYHAMFLGVKKPLEEGQTFDALLTFEKAGEVTVTFNVKEPYRKKKK